MGRAQNEGFGEQGSKENIWTLKGYNNRTMEELAQRRTSHFVLIPKYH
jgi:hypothetical protein